MRNILVWGNHHCSNESGFQDTFDKLLELHTVFPRPMFHQIDMFSDQSITGLKENLDNGPIILVVIVGDECLVDEQPTYELIKRFESFFASLSQFPRLSLITCGLIPVKQASIYNQHKFGSANYKLRTLHSRFNQMFIPTDGTFCSLDFKLTQCLNKRGGKKLARIIFQYLNAKFPKYFLT